MIAPNMWNSFGALGLGTLARWSDSAANWAVDHGYPAIMVIVAGDGVIPLFPGETVVVMVTPTQLLVQGKALATLAEIEAQEGLVIVPLREALKAQTDRMLRSTQKVEIASREITILGDKSVPYRVLKKVMATCTDADYGKLSLAVLQRDEALNMTNDSANSG